MDHKKKLTTTLTCLLWSGFTRSVVRIIRKSGYYDLSGGSQMERKSSGGIAVWGENRWLPVKYR